MNRDIVIFHWCAPVCVSIIISQQLNVSLLNASVFNLIQDPPTTFSPKICENMKAKKQRLWILVLINAVTFVLNNLIYLHRCCTKTRLLELIQQSWKIPGACKIKTFLSSFCWPNNTKKTKGLKHCSQLEQCEYESWRNKWKLAFSCERHLSTMAQTKCAECARAIPQIGVILNHVLKGCSFWAQVSRIIPT